MNFRYKNTNYFIYSMHEIDEKNYVKLYIVKIMNIIDKLVVIPVKDKKEWATMQDMIKVIIKDLQDKKEDYFKDLDFNDLHGITLPDAKSFKMDTNLLNKLLEDVSEKENINDLLLNIEVNELLLDTANTIIKKEDKNFVSEAFSLGELEETLTEQERYDKVQAYLIKLKEETINRMAQVIEAK